MEYYAKPFNYINTLGLPCVTREYLISIGIEETSIGYYDEPENGKYDIPIESHPIACKIGYVTFAGIIVSENDYDTIEATHHMYIVSKEGKYGAITGEGKIWAPCIYDCVKWKGNGFGGLVAIKDGEELVLNPKPKNYVDDDSDYESQHQSYGKYAGSYAQDVAGYSDDDIDTIFDGDPSAYWNID